MWLYDSKSSALIPLQDPQEEPSPATQGTYFYSCNGPPSLRCRKYRLTFLPLGRKQRAPWGSRCVSFTFESMARHGATHMLWAPRDFLIVSYFFSEKAMAPHSSTPAGKMPWMEEPGRLQSMGSLRVGHDWATLLSLFTFMHWKRKWQPTPVFLPGESQGRGSLVGCRPWGRTESDPTEAT